MRSVAISVCFGIVVSASSLFGQCTMNLCDSSCGTSYFESDQAYQDVPSVVTSSCGSDSGCGTASTCDSTCNGCFGSRWARKREEATSFFNPKCGATFSLFGGLNFVQVDDDFRILDPDPDFNSDWMAGFSIGRRHTSNLRTELEIAYRLNEEDEPLVSVPGGVSGVNGKVQAYTGMFNLLIDLGNTRMRPYFGAGIGFANVESDLELTVANNVQRTQMDQNALVYQGIGGVASALSQRSELFLEYRYVGFSDLSPLSGRPELEIGDFAHSFVAGWRMTF